MVVLCFVLLFGFVAGANPTNCVAHFLGLAGQQCPAVGQLSQHPNMVAAALGGAGGRGVGTCTVLLAVVVARLYR